MSLEQGRPAGNAHLRRSAKWIALILFVLYCADLGWKLAHWRQYAVGLDRWQLGTLLMLRLLFMAFLLWMFLRARRAG